MTPSSPPSAARVSELLRLVHLLELAARRNAVNWLSGDYLTTIRGGGLVFHEARKYVDGESSRLIDWNITARLGEPYVKVHRDERQRDIMLLVDVSPSMHSGFQRKTKLEFAVELAASLAVTAIEGGDRLGYVLFADRVLAESRPRSGRKQLHKTLASLLTWTRPWDAHVPQTDPRVALHEVAKLRGSRFVIFLVSDFIDHDVPDDLRYVSPRHDTTLLHVYDPVEAATSFPVVFTGYSPEGAPGGERVTGDAAAEGRSIEKTQRWLRERAAQLGIGVESLSTAAPVRIALDTLFHRKRRQLVRR